MQLADFVQQRGKIDLFRMKIEAGPGIDQAGGIEQIFDEVGEACLLYTSDAADE